MITNSSIANQYTGTLRVRPIRASFMKSAFPKEGRQSPYVILSIGNHAYKSQIDRHGGGQPVWNEYFVMRGLYSNQLIIQVVDHERFGTRDYVMGEGIVDITGILAKPVSEYWISLSAGDVEVGKILMSFDSRPGDHVGMTQAEGLVLADLNKTSLKDKIMTKFGNVETYTYGIPDSMIQSYIRTNNTPVVTQTMPTNEVVTTRTIEQIVPTQSVIIQNSVQPSATQSQVIQEKLAEPVLSEQPGYLPTQLVSIGKIVEQPVANSTSQVIQTSQAIPQNQIIKTTTTTEVITGMDNISNVKEVYHQPKPSVLTEVAVSQPILTGASQAFLEPGRYSLSSKQTLTVSEYPQRLRSIVPTGVRHYQGALRVFPIEAIFDQEGPGGRRIDPYVVLRLGEYKYKTHAKKWGGRNPYWSEYFNVTAVDKPFMDVFVYDRPKSMIGQSQINIDNVLAQSGYSEHWVELLLYGERVGQILIAFEPQPNMTNEQYLYENKQKKFFDRIRDKMSKTMISSIPLTNERYHDHHLVGNEQYQGAVRVIPVEAFLTQTTAKKIDPYVIMTCGLREYRSSVDKKGDHYPTWSEYFDLKGVVDKTMIVKVFDKDAVTRDDFIGEGVVYIGDVIQSGVRTQNWINLSKGNLDAGRLLVICEPKQYEEQELRDSVIKTKTVKGQYLGIPTSVAHDDFAVQHGGSLRVTPVEAIFNDFGHLLRHKPYIVIRFGSTTFKSHKTRGTDNHFRWNEYFSLDKIESNAMDVKIYSRRTLLGEGVYLLDEVVRTQQYTEYAFDLRSKEGLNAGKIVLGFEAKGFITREEQGTEFNRKPVWDRLRDTVMVHKASGVPLNNRTFDSMNLVSNSTLPTQPVLQSYSRSSGHLLVTPLSFEFTWQNAGVAVTPYFLFSADNKQHKLRWHSSVEKLEPFRMSHLNHDLLTVSAYDKEACEPSDFIGEGTTSLLNAFNSNVFVEQWVDLFISKAKVGRVLLGLRSVELPTEATQSYDTYQRVGGLDVPLTNSQYVFEPIRTNQTLAVIEESPQKIYFEDASINTSMSESNYETEVARNVAQDIYPTIVTQRVSLRDMNKATPMSQVDFSTGTLRIKLLAGQIGDTGREKIKPYIVFKTSGQELKSHADKKHNHNPVWTDYFDIENITEDYVQIFVYDKEALHHDPLLGEGAFCIRSLLVDFESIEHWVPISLNGINVGRILLKIKYKNGLAVSRTISGLSEVMKSQNVVETVTAANTADPQTITYYDKYEDVMMPNTEKKEGHIRSAMEKLKNKIKSHSHHHHHENKTGTEAYNESHLQKF